MDMIDNIRKEFDCLGLHYSKAISEQGTIIRPDSQVRHLTAILSSLEEFRSCLVGKDKRVILESYTVVLRSVFYAMCEHGIIFKKEEWDYMKSAELPMKTQSIIRIIKFICDNYERGASTGMKYAYLAVIALVLRSAWKLKLTGALDGALTACHECVMSVSVSHPDFAKVLQIHNERMKMSLNDDIEWKVK